MLLWGIQFSVFLLLSSVFQKALWSFFYFTKLLAHTEQSCKCEFTPHAHVKYQKSRSFVEFSSNSHWTEFLIITPGYLISIFELPGKLFWQLFSWNLYGFSYQAASCDKLMNCTCYKKILVIKFLNSLISIVQI